MPHPVLLRPVSAAEVRPLRRAVLRPHQTEADLVWSGDDAEGTLHVGAFDGDRLVGVASIGREDDPSLPGPAWRLRGMATLPELRGRGVGRSLLAACIEHACARGAERVWCNARTTAEGFYAKAGFRTRGPVFVLPDIGPHVVMVRALGAP